MRDSITALPDTRHIAYDGAGVAHYVFTAPISAEQCHYGEVTVLERVFSRTDGAGDILCGFVRYSPDKHAFRALLIVVLRGPGIGPTVRVEGDAALEVYSDLLRADIDALRKRLPQQEG